MKITDKKAVSIFNRLKCAELVESIDSYPEDERNGRSDLQFLADEISYFRSCYEESGHSFNKNLDEARELLRETKDGKRIPLDPRTLKPKQGYYPHNIDSAKRTVSEYKQLLYYTKKLNDLGYYGKW